MSTSTQFFTTTSKLNQSDWYFLPTLLNGTLGIIIGFFIANFLNWV